MTTTDTQALEITVRGEVVASNADIFRAEWQAILAEINRSPSTDAEFAEAEEHVKRLSDAEAATKAAKEGALKECEQLYSLLSTLDETCEEIRAARLQLSKAIETKKAELRERLISDAICEIGMEKLRARTVFIATLQSAIKGKRTLESIKSALAFAVDLINGTIKANHGFLTTFEECHGTALTHDRENLLTMPTQALETELRKRFDVQKARDEAAAAKKEADELRAEAKRKEDELEAKKKEAFDVMRDLPAQEAAREFVESHGAALDAPNPPASKAATVDPKAEMAGFIAAVRSSAGAMKEARALLKDSGNIAKAQAFADGLNQLYKDLIA